MTMLERMQHLPEGIDGVKAVGRVSREDYERVLEPLIDGARREGRRLRLLYQVGPEFEGFSAGAAWEDAKLGLASLRMFEGCAVVTDVGWIRESTRLAAFLMPCPVRVFGNGERDEAVEWLRSLPEGAAVSHRLLPESGVLVVEVNQALRAEDFDALAATADQYIDAHGDLAGIVIHARSFPGWENLGGLIRHVRFLRDHHRRVRRVALASDSKVAGLAPKLAEHFVQAEVRRFGYDELDAAIAWAAEGKGTAAKVPAEHEAGSGR
jgi:stage II sporulation SpoAA-like protein